jgi:uncharacterized protein (UPF0333 family)
MEERAQTSIEYLLIIVGAVVIVTIIAIFVKNVANSINESAQTTIDNPPESGLN